MKSRRPCSIVTISASTERKPHMANTRQAASLAQTSVILRDSRRKPEAIVKAEPHRPSSETRVEATRLVRKLSDKRQIDVNLLGDPKNEYAWILQTPLDPRDNEVGFGRALRSIDVDLHGDSQLMRSAMQREDPGDLYRRVADASNRAL